MFTHKNLMTVCCAAVLAFGLAACGSSSDDDNVAVTTPMNGGDGDADAMDGDGDGDGDGDAETPAETLAAAQADYDALTDESTDEVRAAAVAALEEALMLAGNEDAYVAYLEKKVADQEAAAEATAAAAAAEEASDMAKAVIAAIEADEDNVGEANPDAPMVTLAASSAGMLTAKQEGYTMSAAPEEIAGWRGRTLEKDGDTTVIYTNIEDEVPTAFGGFGGLYTKASAGPNAPENYTMSNDGGTDALPTIRWSDATRNDDAEQVDRSGDSGDDVVTTFAGSVRGVDGTFSCTGTSCALPTLEEGVLSSDNVWSFAPTDPGAMIHVKDTAYVSFGWWLNAMGTDGDDYEFDAFASAPGMTANMLMGDALEGSATYKGGAAGKFAMQSTTDDSASGGHFTASATLTANFDANFSATDGDNDEDGVSIGGVITNFMTGDMSRPNWKVTLTAPAATNMVAPITGAATVWKTGGAVDGTGEWSANFYGVEKDTMHPMAATGEFDAAIGGDDNIARISGAFGATKQ